MRQSANPKDEGYCLDCSPEFKAEMLSAGKCAHPETRFVLWREPVTQDLEMVGISESSRWWKRAQEGRTIINEDADEDEDQQQGEG
jgi:hypothetical protein